ncbi:hypothetical protein NM688_g5767 [Phlebia brevispora]|uniref:Uncharacterized protein n=1 Tax=Phlebia brevispora TaxID=194682 RepID=A0ACC1SPX6_9APHY|nr:hypothetical protein NM688_g5767 [Phlebia brevispora]
MMPLVCSCGPVPVALNDAIRKASVRLLQGRSPAEAPGSIVLGSFASQRLDIAHLPKIKLFVELRTLRGVRVVPQQAESPRAILIHLSHQPRGELLTVMDDKLEMQTARRVPLSRSQRYYADRGDLYIQTFTDGVVFRISERELCQDAIGLQEAFMQIRTADAVAGRTEGNAVLLVNVDSTEFGVLCDYIYNPRFHEEFGDVEALVSLLRMGFIFRIPSAYRDARRGLSNHAGLSYARKLSLSERYGISDWFRPSLRALLSQPLAALREDDLSYLRPQMSLALIRIHHAVNGLRHSMTLSIPSAHGVCEARSHCALAWSTLWTVIAIPRLLSSWPGNLSLNALSGAFHDHPAHSAICRACFVSYMDVVAALLMQEDDIISEGIEAHFNLESFARIASRLAHIGMLPL